MFICVWEKVMKKKPIEHLSEKKTNTKRNNKRYEKTFKTNFKIQKEKISYFELNQIENSYKKEKRCRKKQRKTRKKLFEMYN